ncbi:related to AVT3 - vacuolar transporter, involved in amino acid efflux from the vacuole [Cephalotrichum gorgonifer]|uniref:Related to AVT3 - vacuolar transporter, involved in amino acid efflux from the vacuole n=1 Tax=Cephalotrichum gorgonifer TaxID=2041049 RepID=A0AAE8MS73_9PEZI|nr:related to AVT3 - vacuolar transporter, involved in amino acid efflux from the vacuole [Cephalotrichum gorgonifer]
MASPSRQPPPADSLSSSPANFRGRDDEAPSGARAESIARLASPVRGPPLSSSYQRNGAMPTSHQRNGTQQDNDATPLAGAGPNSLGPGVSALAAALSNSLGASPPRFGTPPARSVAGDRPHSPTLSAAPVSATPTTTNYGSFDNRARPAAYEDPEVVKRHLVHASDTGSDTDSAHGKGKQPADSSDGQDQEFSSLRLQGGDITRGIYKWTEEAEARNKMQRSKSFHLSRPEPESEVLDIKNMKVPGGFRRDYIRRTIDDTSGGGLDNGEEPGQLPRMLTTSFLEFLTLYGHFGGEELEEDDEVLLPGEYFSSGADDDYFGDGGSSGGEDREPMEDSALLTPSLRKRRRKPRGGSGNNSPTTAVLLLLKSFVGTGVLFLPRAYLNGGMLFSNVVLLAVAALSYYCFILLVSSRLEVEGSYGDIGGKLYGKWMRMVILASIVVSQIGFVSAYIVFTSQNLQAVILAVSNCKTDISVTWLIILQMIIFLPFSLLRDIGKLGFTALIADAFILVGLAYLFYYDVITLSANGVADIVQFNKKDWTLFIGTAIFTFEGIGLIIPIQESMRHPAKFPGVMALVMVIITTLFVTMGAVSYAAYGSKTETVVLLNLPQDNKLVNGTQFLYSIAILLSTPLQLFPAIKISENALFTKSGKYNPYIKWQKNVFRFLLVTACALLAWAGADNLDKFVALVGNFACIPLVYIYPPLLHYKAVARSRLWRVSDILLCVFGFIAMGYTTSLTVISWAQSEGPDLPRYCDPA